MKRSRLVFLLSLAGTASFAALTAAACSSSYEVDPEFCTKNPGHAECSPGAGSGAGGASNQGSGGTGGGTAGTGGSTGQGGSGGSAGSGNASGAGGTAGAGGSAGVMGQGGSGGVGGSSFTLTCKIVTPAICSHADEVPPAILGQIFVDGVTNQSDAPGNRIKGEVGYGKLGTDPRTDLSWSFSKAIPNEAFDFGQDSDEYQVTLPTQSPDGVSGQTRFSYAYRFTLDNTIIAYCDAVGGGGFDPTKTGVWTVTIGLTNCPPNSLINPSPTRVDARGASP
jgi:hypothetical protein